MSKKVPIVAVAVALVFCFFALYRYHASSQFASSYKVYSQLATAHVNTAIIHGAKSNPLRQELNQTLARVLSDTSMNNADRIALSQRGLILLKQGEKQIDAMGEVGDKTKSAISSMEMAAYGSLRNDIVALAHESFNIIADIRGLSYRANYHAAEIFNHIIKDGGKLIPAYISDLNEQIPFVEERFDKQTNLYSDLESVNSRIENKYEELGMF